MEKMRTSIRISLLFIHPSSLHPVYPVHHPEQTFSMGNHDHRPSLAGREELMNQKFFGLTIKMRRRLIQDNDPGITKFGHVPHGVFAEKDILTKYTFRQCDSNLIVNIHSILEFYPISLLSS